MNLSNDEFDEITRARARLRRAAEALAEMAEAERLPGDWLVRLDRYRTALERLLQVEQAA